MMIELKDKNDKELLLMVKEEIQRIKEIVEELKTSPTATPPPTTANTPTPTATAVASADLPSLAS